MGIMRATYRELRDDEKAAVAAIKTKGEELWQLLEAEAAKVAGAGSRELSLAKTKLEESVMWAVKHITG